MKNNFRMFGYYKFLILLSLGSCISAADVQLTSDGPIVRGGTINFFASVYDENQLASNTKLEYTWNDDGIPRHTRVVEIENATDVWTVLYDTSYPAGEYVVQVMVKKCIMLNIYCYGIGSARHIFHITENLNGDIKLRQGNETRTTNYVSNDIEVTHIVDIKKSDKDYISNATTILTYWFVDCTYYGITTDFKFPFNFTKVDESHTVEALVVADFTPLPPTTTVPPSTTTVTTTTTVKPPSNTTRPITASTQTPRTTTATVSSILVPKANSSVPRNSIKVVRKRSIGDTSSGKSNGGNENSSVMIKINGSLVPYNRSFPFVCNRSQVALDSNKTYGYFSKRLEVRAPLSKINITGNTWLQPGNILSLKVKCSGSQTLQYCIHYEKGRYNVTGNETCSPYLPLYTCDFSITRFFPRSENTIVVILRNDVSKVIKSVFVNVYKVNKQTQLSVIVVPVAFSLVAVVLIIFGVAYYIQNRSRFIVEVADFNFGQQFSDIEYKTFRERLRDSLANAFTRGPSPSTSEVPVWPPGQKYGSMT